VGVVTMHTGVELEGVASVAVGLGPEPLEQRGRVPGAPCRLPRHEVIDVEIVTPRETVGDAESGGAGRVCIAGVE
jgi:hypothetical protein